MQISKALFALSLATAAITATAAGPNVDKSALARGRYVVATSGCNDCHTIGYPESGGKVPEAEWLTGGAVGFSGPWGTTYPANLRITAQSMSEQAWMMRARSELRPPMPWFSLRDMSDSDLRAVYHYIRSLGAKGTVQPAYVPPGGKVATPYIDFMPKNLPAKAAAR